MTRTVRGGMPGSRAITVGISTYLIATETAEPKTARGGGYEAQMIADARYWTGSS